MLSPGSRRLEPANPATVSTNLASSTRATRRRSVQTPSRERLLGMLYDGACRFLTEAAAAMRAGDIEATHVKLGRAEAIISHLQHTLDMEKGEIPQYLRSIYLFFGRHLNRARIERDPKKIEDVIQLLGQLREAWSAISPEMGAPSAPSAPSAPVAERLAAGRPARDRRCDRDLLGRR
jgi:flagellar protein FliS